MDTTEQLESENWRATPPDRLSVELAIALWNEGRWDLATKIQILMVGAGMISDEEFVSQVEK